MKQIRLFLGIGILSIIWISLSWPKENLRLIFCDVGQGDASLLVSNDFQMLIDVGPNNKKISDCLSKYVPFFDKTIEVVVNTHPQADHLGGMNDVLDHYRVKEFVTTGEEPESKTMKNILERIKALGIKTIIVDVGDVIRYRDLYIDVLWPSQNIDNEVAGVSSDGNHRAIVLRLRTKAISALFASDIGENEELALASMGLLKKTDIVKVPHHGSKYSSSEKFSNSIKPKWAVVSVGGKNSYGHPSMEALSRYDTFGSTLLRTDQNGSIEFVANEKGYWRNN